MARQRPLFDPKRTRAVQAAKSAPRRRTPTPGELRTLTPRQVNDLVRGAIRQQVPAVLHVVGEIADLSRPRSGHLYFSLRDRDSELRCVMWRSSARRLKFTPEAGMEVIATGALDVYTPRGTYQLIARAVEPRGTGALEVAFRQLVDKLTAEGLFAQSRKKSLPRVPRRIALITSLTGAAMRDVIQTLARRYPAAEVCVFPVRVQGDGAAQEIAHAVRQMNTVAPQLGGIDVAIVGRGGGSLEDLWAFNEEIVARAVAASGVPIVSAVGHEVDYSICDLAADVRAATPTAAAELIAPPVRDLHAELAVYAQRLERGLDHRLALFRGALAELSAADGLARPLHQVREQQQRLDEVMAALREALFERVQAARAVLNRAHFGMLRQSSGEMLRRLGRQLDQRWHTLQHAAAAQHRRGDRRLSQLAQRLRDHIPRVHVARGRDRLAALEQRLRRVLAGELQSTRRRLNADSELLAAVHPRRVLRRGFSITRDARTGAVLRSIGDVEAGQRLRVELADGEFKATAEDPRQGRLFD